MGKFVDDDGEDDPKDPRAEEYIPVRHRETICNPPAHAGSVVDVVDGCQRDKKRVFVGAGGERDGELVFRESACVRAIGRYSRARVCTRARNSLLIRRVGDSAS